MITHLEPDTLMCKVKCALRSITTNKTSGGDGIPVELFQILIDGVKVMEFELSYSNPKRWSEGDGIRAELFQILKDDAVKVLHSTCQQIWKTAVATELEKVSFHSKPKERQYQRMLKLLPNCTHLTR